MARSALQDCVTFLGEVGDLEPVYAISDAFLLSSRLDPLPNVSIDAAHRGIPIICFEGASGTAELLAKDEITAIGVVPHMDAQAAGRVIAHLAQDDAARQELSAAIKNLANETFSMARYVAKLDAIGASHALASNA
jgi:glycosyltransferase involved in cell wall biosynthesis